MADSGEVPPTATVAPPAEPPAPKQGRTRAVVIVVLVVLVLVAAGVVTVLLLNRGDGTSRTAGPLEVRRLIATFPCTPDRPGTPENLRLTAGQEVVQVPRAGCAVVGDVVGSIDHLSKVESKKGTPECTVTIDAPREYGQIVDNAANVSDGQVRALVAGGWLIDVRAVISYAGRPSQPLHVVFTAPDQAACDAVAGALKLS
jgi:hypothetical protein